MEEMRVCILPSISIQDDMVYSSFWDSRTAEDYVALRTPILLLHVLRPFENIPGKSEVDYGDAHHLSFLGSAAILTNPTYFDQLAGISRRAGWENLH